MDAFFKWLATNPLATTVLIVAFGTAMLVYLVAFFQGRDISFWPPKIGQRPARSAPMPSERGRSEENRTWSPLISKGSALTGASGTTYVVEAEVYGGANATLYRARTPKGDLVISKVFWRGLAPGSPAWELFSQEQRAAEILKHRNIVGTCDRGLFGGYPFTVMEYLAGGTLRDWLRTHDRLPGDDILSIAGQIADALDYAHSRGVIHRDVKPGNILFESDPHARVALSDFGVARMLGAVEIDITAAGGPIGSPGYLAPEVIERGEVTAASDIYSFGIVVYEMVAGRGPFDELLEPYGLMRAKIAGDAPDVRQFRQAIPETVALRLADTLSRDVSRRPHSARGVLSGTEQSVAQL